MPLEIKITEHIACLVEEAKASDCVISDPTCQKVFGDLCARGCFEVTVDLQTMQVIEE
jgi:hypothetical protein